MNSKNEDTPLISVVMPVYNSAAFLAEAIESILSQSYSLFEFIIIDDCSTDNSAGIIKNYALRDVRIRPLYLPHSGAGGAANAGIAAAKGELIARMDADDIALPERLSTQIAWMRSTGVDICGSCIKTFGAEVRIMWFPETHEAIKNEMLFRCALMQPTVMLRADIAKRHLYKENLYFEDYELWTRLAPKYRMGNVPQVLLKYRTHPRQRHVQKATEVSKELREYCQVYYRSLFSNASIEDEMTIARLVCNEPIKSLAELDQVGEILLRLADVDDRFLRSRMAQRWYAACRRSTSLGFQSFRIFQKKRALFSVQQSRPMTLWLAFTSLMRLGPRSVVALAMKGICRHIRG